MTSSEPWLARVIRSCGEKAVAQSANRDAMIEAYLQEHPEKRIVAVDLPGFDFKSSTPDELKQAGVVLCQEADRLEAIEPRLGPVYVLREIGKTCTQDFLFCDKVEKDVRLWILSRLGAYADKGVLLYREWWVDDPTNGMKRVVKRETVGDPIKDAQEAQP